MVVLVLLAGCAVASAQDVGAGKFELSGWPVGGLYLKGGDDNTEVNFNDYSYGGGATFYLNPTVGVEVEASYGLGLAQGVVYKNKDVHHVEVPNTLQTSGNIVLFLGGATKNKQFVPYVTGGAGVMTLISRGSTAQFGINSAEYHTAENVGAGAKVFRGGEAHNWGVRGDWRFIFVNSKSSAVPFFAQSKQRWGYRMYIGLLYTVKR